MALQKAWDVPAPGGEDTSRQDLHRRNRVPRTVPLVWTRECARECEGAGADSPSFRLPVFERKPLFILLSNESLARPRGRGRGTREENGRGRGGGHGRRVLDQKTEAGRGGGRGGRFGSRL